MKVLFVSSPGKVHDVVPFINSQAFSLQKNGIIVDHYLIKNKGLIGYLKEIPKLRMYLKGNNYDIIHAHYVFAGCVSYISSVKSRHIISFMGSDVYGTVNNKGHATARGYIDVVASIILQPFVDKIIVKSNNLKKSVFLKRKAVVIPNGVDFAKFNYRNKRDARNLLGLPQDHYLVLFLGNPNDPRKNISLLKNAIQVIRDNRILLISPFPVPHKTVEFYYNACDVLVLSSYLEGSPNVIKEGMASNIPIVSTRAGDVEEVISNTEGCFICDYDPIDMGHKILKALTFKNGTNGRKNVTHLEINSIAKRIITIYKELLIN